MVKAGEPERNPGGFYECGGVQAISNILNRGPMSRDVRGTKFLWHLQYQAGERGCSCATLLLSGYAADVDPFITAVHSEAVPFREGESRYLCEAGSCFIGAPHCIGPAL